MQNIFKIEVLKIDGKVERFWYLLMKRIKYIYKKYIV